MTEMMPVMTDRAFFFYWNSLFDYMPDHDLIEKYRFPKHVLNEIDDLVKDDMTPKSSSCAVFSFCTLLRQNVQLVLQ